jgi:hypothetical protein
VRERDGDRNGDGDAVRKEMEKIMDTEMGSDGDGELDAGKEGDGAEKFNEYAYCTPNIKDGALATSNGTLQNFAIFQRE